MGVMVQCAANHLARVHPFRKPWLHVLSGAFWSYCFTRDMLSYTLKYAHASNIMLNEREAVALKERQLFADLYHEKRDQMIADYKEYYEKNPPQPHH